MVMFWNIQDAKNAKENREAIQVGSIFCVFLALLAVQLIGE
jgi:hypothetical protein